MDENSEYLEGIVPRDYQKKIFETCAKKNCLIVLPTGLGKTLIALMLTIKRMKQFPGERVLFLAPTRPLAEQHLNTFKKHTPELFGEMQLFTGKVQAKNRKNIWQTSDIIFSTPQCIANDIKNKLYSLEEVCLLIEDEAHRCIKNYDYTYISQKYIKQAKNPRIIGLTASPGSDMKKIEEICKNLSAEEVELRTRESKDIKPYLQRLEFEKVEIILPPEFEKIRDALKSLFNKYVDELKSRKVLFSVATKLELIKLQKKLTNMIIGGNKHYNILLAVSSCAQALKLQHALELLETQTLSSFNKYMKSLFGQAEKKQSKGVIKLVKKPEFNFAYVKSQELLAKNIEHPKLNKIVEIVKQEKEKNEKIKIIVFTQFRDTARIISKKLNQLREQRINAKVFVGQAKKITENTGKDFGEVTGLSQKEQKKIIEQFSSGEINVLCATCIAEEGLDIPEVNIVIFYEPIPSAIRAIQRAGRTARLMKGKLIILITKKTRDEAYYYVSRTRERKMHSIINSIKENLSNNKNNLSKNKQKSIKDY